MKFQLCSSKYYLILWKTLSLATLLLIIFSPCVITIKITLILIATCYIKYSFNKPELKELSKEKDHWKLKIGDKIFEGVLAKDSVITPYVCVLRFKTNKFTRTFVMFEDSFQNCDDYRRFNLELRF